MADSAEPGPTSVWTKPRRAPSRQAPSVERIVQIAIAVADAEGLPAVSMRRVASDLGSGTASLYRYVASRDELLDLMIDSAQGETLTPVSGDWRAGLIGVARQVRATLLRHPWLGAELAGRPAIGANSLRRHDTALAAAAALTPDIDLAARAVDTVLAYVYGTVSRESAEAQARRRTGMTKQQWRDSVAPYLREAIGTGAYPQFARMVVDGVDLDAGERFELGLGFVLDGVAAGIGRANSGKR